MAGLGPEPRFGVATARRCTAGLVTLSSLRRGRGTELHRRTGTRPGLRPGDGPDPCIAGSGPEPRFGAGTAPAREPQTSPATPALRRGGEASREQVSNPIRAPARWRLETPCEPQVPDPTGASVP
jgi:hypothetical protein